MGDLLLNQPGLDEPRQLAAGGESIDTVQPLVIAVGELFVISEVNQGQSLAVLRREPGELVEKGDRLWAHQSVVAKGHPNQDRLSSNRSGSRKPRRMASSMARRFRCRGSLRPARL